ncbi:hypothetical protein GCM10009565_52060 [Amycolatopsis albidoflavus]
MLLALRGCEALITQIRDSIAEFGEVGLRLAILLITSEQVGQSVDLSAEALLLGEPVRKIGFQLVLQFRPLVPNDLAKAPMRDLVVKRGKLSIDDATEGFLRTCVEVGKPAVEAAQRRRVRVGKLAAVAVHQFADRSRRRQRVAFECRPQGLERICRTRRLSRCEILEEARKTIVLTVSRALDDMRDGTHEIAAVNIRKALVDAIPRVARPCDRVLRRVCEIAVQPRRDILWQTPLAQRELQLAVHSLRKLRGRGRDVAFCRRRLQAARLRRPAGHVEQPIG